MADFPKPDRAPLRAYYNLRRSYYVLRRAYSSAFFLSYSFNLYSSCLSLSSSSICSGVFSGGGASGAYSDMDEVVLF